MIRYVFVAALVAALVSLVSACAFVPFPADKPVTATSRADATSSASSYSSQLSVINRRACREKKCD